MAFWKKSGPPPRPFASAIVPAAGASRRMGGTNKLLVEIAGMPVLGHSLLALERCPDIDEIIVSAREDDMLAIADLANDLGLNKLRKVVRGGENRTQSVLNALMEISQESQLVAVHDGARPCATPGLISRVVKEALERGAAVAGIKSADTVKECDKNGMVKRTLDRTGIALIQTPQCFEPALLKGALTKAVAGKWQVTDDCAAVERLGMPVCVTYGEATNIKITTRQDLIVAEAIIDIMRGGLR